MTVRLAPLEMSKKNLWLHLFRQKARRAVDYVISHMTDIAIR
jgi:hypothetical protein